MARTKGKRVFNVTSLFYEHFWIRWTCCGVTAVGNLAWEIQFWEYRRTLLGRSIDLYLGLTNKTFKFKKIVLKGKIWWLVKVCLCVGGLGNLKGRWEWPPTLIYKTLQSSKPDTSILQSFYFIFLIEETNEFPSEAAHKPSSTQ